MDSKISNLDLVTTLDGNDVLDTSDKYVLTPGYLLLTIVINCSQLSKAYVSKSFLILRYLPFPHPKSKNFVPVLTDKMNS